MYWDKQNDIKLGSKRSYDDYLSRTIVFFLFLSLILDGFEGVNAACATRCTITYVHSPWATYFQYVLSYTSIKQKEYEKRVWFVVVCIAIQIVVVRAMACALCSVQSNLYVIIVYCSNRLLIITHRPMFTYHALEYRQCLYVQALNAEETDKSSKLIDISQDSIYFQFSWSSLADDFLEKRIFFIIYLVAFPRKLILNFDLECCQGCPLFP